MPRARRAPAIPSARSIAPSAFPALAILLILSAASPAAAAAPPDPPDPLGVHALVGARVVVSPGEVIGAGTVVIRDGRIEAVGADVEPPPDARIWELDGLTVYPGLIEPYAVRPWPGEEGDDEGAGRWRRRGGSRGEDEAEDPGAGHPNPMVRAEREAAEVGLPDRTARRLRKAGYATAAVAPGSGVLRGWSAVVSLADEPLRESLLVPRLAQHVRLRERNSDGYPESLMGAIALTRETFLQAGWYRDAWRSYEASPGQPRPPRDASLAALGPAVADGAPVVFESESLLGTFRAARLAEELGLEAWIVASGEEYRSAAEVAGLGTPLLVPLAFPEVPGEEDDSLEENPLSIGLDELSHWKKAPGNPAALRDAGAEVAVTSFGLEDPEDLHERMMKAIGAGLGADDALAAVTTVPARLLGLEDRLGTIEAGKLASLVVTEGDLFTEDTEIRAVWVEGARYDPSEERAEEWGREDGRGWGRGRGRDWRRGRGRRSDTAEDRRDAGTGEAATAPAIDPAEVSLPAPWGLEIPERPAAVLVRGATIWTAGPEGTLENADLLVRSGKIAAVGAGLDAPAGALVIDGSGLHVTPGLIDAHSHTAAEGGLNEGTDIVTPEVRVADVLDPTDPNIYRQLAGGLTAANVLHGSANAIGGQNAIIKLRWGASAEELLIDDAQPGVKFALGENPKQSNWGTEEDRFPQTRMGVERAIAGAFERALDHRHRSERAAAEGTVPPAPDLRAEALLEILDGERHVHSHAYRADEMLMLLGLSERYGFRIDAFQHGLEAYKIADELAARDVGASVFSDWWAYKYEVVDAIPYNGAILADRGVVVSFNSDSDELARRLNTEAAKAVRYGGMSEEEALKLVTLNPAIQLGIDHRTGTLEPGKDADFVLWNGHPLSTYSRAEQTWVDGRRYFDREEDRARREAVAAEREALLAEARAAAKERSWDDDEDEDDERPGDETDPEEVRR